MFAFILRPFGRKTNHNTGAAIDFEEVHRRLIGPALQATGLSGTTLGFGGVDDVEQVLEALLTADLILADLSIPQALVSYDLGLAHALRQRRTVLIAAEGGSGADSLAPLGLRWCRYLATDPGATVPALTAMIQGSLRSEAIDSPVYALVPGLQPPRAPDVPEGFREEIERARRSRDLGHLRLLSLEARHFHWRHAALPLVGDAQRGVGDLQGARDTFEHRMTLEPTDSDAAIALAGLHQRLRDFRRSDELIHRTLASLPRGSVVRARALAMLGRSAKASWQDGWRSRPAASERRAAALRSAGLRQAFDHYLQAFKLDLNEYFPGVTALSLGRIMFELATALPEVWASQFDDDAQASLQLSNLESEIDLLAAGVGFALAAAAERSDNVDPWIELGRAEHELLVSTRPARVAERFRKVVAGERYMADLVLTQLEVYAALEVRAEPAHAAMAVVQELAPEARALESAAAPATSSLRALLFVGHGIDEPGRTHPRFPRSGIAVAQAAIRDAVVQAVGSEPHRVLGVAGASSGGDLLFHEACATVGVPSLVCLGVPASEYQRLGVAGAGPEWEARFRDLLSRGQTQVLSPSSILPRWLARHSPYGAASPNDFWGRDTAWRYHTAAAVGPITLIALWDGQAGATADLVVMARENGARIIVLDTVALFGGAPAEA